METNKQQYLKVVAPNQSPNDVRQYKAVELPNKLKVVLISDPTVEKSACAVSVGVGSLCDPDRSLGLAHFLEHMLFMGSENYPEHNEYSSFINNHGGSDNAFTSMDETNYFFEIANDQFPEGVKRLADFFRKPILNPSCVEKQRQAVHQQYMLWTSDDSTRKWEIIHALGDGPYARFTIGNQDTLNHKDILDDLRAYYDKCYSSNIINAVLVSNLSIQQQEALLPPLARIENRNYDKMQPQKPFPKSKLGKLIKIESIKDEYTMQFIFVVDSLKLLYRKHIADYLTYVLGHESEGSLSSYLESEGLISQLMAYDHDIPGATVIGIELTLTQPGTMNYKKVYEIVMQYISQLKPQEFIYNDLKRSSELKWQFLEKIGSSSYSSKIAGKLHYIPMENVLDYKNLFDPFDAEIIGKYLSELNESNLLLFLSSVQPIKGSVVEPYLGGKYKVEDLLNFDKQNIPNFNFLKNNKFLPIGTQLLAEQDLIPKKLAPNVTLLKRNAVCKGGLTLNIYTPQDKVFVELYEQWTSMMLKESTYDAYTLDSIMDFSSSRCIQVSIFAYSQVVKRLIDIIGSEIHPLLMKNQQKSQIFFEIVRERMGQQYDNYFLDETDNVLTNELQRILNAKSEITVEQTLKALENYTMQEFADKIEKFWSNVHLEWIAVGNFDEKEIIEMVNEFQKSIKNKVQAITVEPCLKLTQNFHYTIKIPSPQINTSGTLVYYEFDRNTFRNKLILELLLIHIKEAFFDDLRTSKQLCYIAQSSLNLNSGVIGMKFLVVSSTTDPSHLYGEMVTFIEKHFADLKDITPEKLEEMKDAVMAKQSEPFKNLKQEYEFIVHQITGRTYQFNRKEKEAISEQFKSIQLSDLLAAVTKMHQHHLSIEAVAKPHLKEYQKNKIKHKKFAEIKSKGQFHPDFESPLQHLA